jgi:dUTP pyrophosphatase
MKLKIKKLNQDAQIPKYATPGSAGFDLAAIQQIEIAPGETELVKTGLAVAVPHGFELQVRPRSGTSLKTGLRVANAPGTVDSDYRGEVCVIMTNIGNTTQIINAGDRIAQGVICPVYQIEFEETDTLDDTQRGSNGFGSTGQRL